MIYDFEELLFQIKDVCRIDHPKGTFKVRPRPYAALSYRVSGCGDFIFGGERVVSDAGDILFIPEGVSYDVSYSGGTMIVVHFHDCNYHIPENISFANKAYMADVFFDLLKEWESRRSTHVVKSTVYSIMQFCSESNQKEHSIHSAELAKQIIDNGFRDSEFSVNSLVQMLYTSYPTLRRNFLKRYGMPPKQYLLKLRLDTAVTLLSEGFLSVQEISKRCGFDDARHFSQIFKEKYGVSPSKVSHNLLLK